jgi:hypothetical protein
VNDSDTVRFCTGSPVPLACSSFFSTALAASGWRAGAAALVAEGPPAATAPGTTAGLLGGVISAIALRTRRKRRC